GPFFALGHALGAAPWLVQRLWLALILTLAAWGAVRLMEELDGPRALTGLLVCVVRGLRAPGWRWPAAFALIVTASGGGVNAAVTAWVLLGPVLLALYARWAGWASWRELWALTWRTVLATALASAWWVL